MFKKVCSVLSGLILTAMALIAAVLLVPNLFGCKNMAVLSGSMEPDIPVGSIVIARPVEAGTLEVGDIITYQLQGDTMVTHRITRILEEQQQVITKGDANDVEDGDPVAYSRIVGKIVLHLPYLGFISIYAKTPLGIAVVCGVLIVLILLLFLPDVLQGKAKREPGN